METQHKTVWTLHAGDSLHGITLQGIYSSREKAVYAIPIKIKELIKYFGGTNDPMVEEKGNWWRNGGYSAYIEQREIDV